MSRRATITKIVEVAILIAIWWVLSGIFDVLHFGTGVVTAIVIALLSRERAAFSRFDQDLVRRVGKLLERAIDNRHLAHRNAVLARVVDANLAELPPASGFLDASFDALSRVYARLAMWQGNIVEITNDLLSAPPAEAGAAINRALARYNGSLGQNRYPAKVIGFWQDFWYVKP